LQIASDDVSSNINAETVIEVGNTTVSLREKVFSNTFIAGAEATFSVIMAAGEAVPAIRPIFAILNDIKKNVDLYAQSNEACSRLSVWCQAIISCLGKLAAACRMDTLTSELLTAVHSPIQEFSELIQTRLKLSKGPAGKLLAFGTSASFRDKSAYVQQKVQTAINALKLQLSVETQIGVNKILERTDLLLNLDVKMDIMLERLESIDGTLKTLDAKVETLLAEKKKRSENEVQLETRNFMMSNMTISSSKVNMEGTPFAFGGTSKVYRGTYCKQLVAAKVQTIQGSNTKTLRRSMAQFEKELALLCQFTHPNVLRIWGACTDSPGVLILVMEYAQVLRLCHS
jgi:hypothetical protein